MRILVLTAGLLLSGCVTPDAIVEPFTTPDGRPAFIAYCGGDSSDISYCYSGARAKCGGNYEIINQQESQRVVGRYSTENRRIEFVCASA